MRSLSHIPLFRRIVIPLLARVNPGNITIRHHYTGEPFRLHSFKHKGYWYYGKARERHTMEMFEKIVRPGAVVFEAGAHIGYVSAYLASLAGPTGRVIVFEPGPNNLPYLRENLSLQTNAEIVEAAVSQKPGVADFYVEDLSGQNNSLYQAYEGLEINRQAAFVKARTSTAEVVVTSFDAFSASRQLIPDFVKIDVEGAEFDVLRGMKVLIEEHHPPLMVEVTRNADEVRAFLHSAGYLLFDDQLKAIGANIAIGANVFCFDQSIVSRKQGFSWLPEEAYPGEIQVTGR